MVQPVILRAVKFCVGRRLLWVCTHLDGAGSECPKVYVLSGKVDEMEVESRTMERKRRKEEEKAEKGERRGRRQEPSWRIGA